MKPSELKKDARFSGRINKEIQDALYRKGISVQDIVDEYIETHIIEVETTVKWKDDED